MKKIAIVTLVRQEDSSIMNNTYTEEVVGFSDVVFTPSHVVFNMTDGSILAYRADRVYQICTYIPEDDAPST